MEYIIKVSKELIWCEDYDRYILVIKQDHEVIGLNFSQGDDFESFKDNFTGIDDELTNFYNSVKHYLVGECELDRINQAMWACFEFRNLQSSRKAL
jgi:hypothetical protein